MDHADVYRSESWPGHAGPCRIDLASFRINVIKAALPGISLSDSIGGDETEGAVVSEILEGTKEEERHVVTCAVALGPALTQIAEHVVA